jgi:ornithine carbamoyltransferase
MKRIARDEVGDDDASLISLADLDADELAAMVDRGVALGEHHLTTDSPLADLAVGIYFRKSSTRTRT